MYTWPFICENSRLHTLATCTASLIPMPRPDLFDLCEQIAFPSLPSLPSIPSSCQPAPLSPRVQAWSGLAAAARAAVSDGARLAAAYRKWKVRQFHKIILRTWRHQVCIRVGVGVDVVVGYRVRRD